MKSFRTNPDKSLVVEYYLKLNQLEDTMMNNEMENLIQNFPMDLKAALDRPTPFPKTRSKFKNIVLVGMGGSGIGAILVKNWFRNEIGLPILVCQDYFLPKFVNKNTLVVACSYSGNTEETLCAVREAHKKKAVIHGITSGGMLAEFCEDNLYACSLVPPGFPPRTQLAHMSVMLTKVLIAHNFDSGSVVNSLFFAYRSLIKGQEEFKKEAQKIAETIHNKRLIIYTDSQNQALAIRAQQQFQENSKVLCSHHLIPEMNHNELVGWAGGSEEIAVLFLKTKATYIQNEKRFLFTQSVISKYTDSIYTIKSEAEDPIIASMQIIHILDWASFYLANLKEVDPMEIEVIKNLKNYLIND